jgi:hypothetical protein
MWLCGNNPNPESKLNKTAVAFLATLAFVGTAQATLIGDNLTIRRSYPNLATDFASPVQTTVVAGAGDAVSPQPQHYTINVEAQNIYFDFHNVSGFGGVAGGIFDGLQFTGITGEILSANVIDATGITVSELTYGAGFVNVNLNGWFSADSYLNIEVLTRNTDVEAVPEPSAFLLTGLGLGALAFLARKRRAA